MIAIVCIICFWIALKIWNSNSFSNWISFRMGFRLSIQFIVILFTVFIGRNLEKISFNWKTFLSKLRNCFIFFITITIITAISLKTSNERTFNTFKGINRKTEKLFAYEKCWLKWDDNYFKYLFPIILNNEWTEWEAELRLKCIGLRKKEKENHFLKGFDIFE